MSLRARLIAALVVLALAGLVTLAAVTYAEQRSFLLDRVDQQAQDAQRVVSFTLVGPGGSDEPPPGLRARLMASAGVPFHQARARVRDGL